MDGERRVLRGQEENGRCFCHRRLNRVEQERTVYKTNIAGLILGDFSLTAFRDEIEKIRYKEQVWTRILEICRDAAFPIWANFPLGHCRQNITLPLGATARMDRKKTSLIFN